MKILKNFCLAMLAGIMISIGGVVFVACVGMESKIVGSIFFALGLTVILMQGYLLFTGKTAYVLENKFSYFIDLILIWFGNLAGCILMGLCVYYALPNLSKTANELCLKKMEQSPIQTVVLGALCGILVYIAVDYYKTHSDKNSIEKYLLVFTCVPIFIICGFEHSVADMFYFAASSELLLFTGQGICYILLVTLGNFVGAVAFHMLRKFAQSKTKEK